MALNLSSLDGTNGFRPDGIDAYDYSGVSVAGAVDVNGDGFADVIVGAPGYGYDAGAPTQLPQTVDGIRLAVSVYASLPFLLCVALLFLYEINKAMESRIELELSTRRSHAGATT